MRFLHIIMFGNPLVIIKSKTALVNRHSTADCMQQAETLSRLLMGNSFNIHHVNTPTKLLTLIYVFLRNPSTDFCLYPVSILASLEIA